MHLEIRVATATDVCVLHDESLRSVRDILSNPNGGDSASGAAAKSVASSPARLQTKAPVWKPCKLSVSFSLERLVEIETRVFCSGSDYLQLPPSPSTRIVAAKVRRPVDIGQALLLSLPTDVLEYTVKIRLWQHFCDSATLSSTPEERVSSHACNRPSSLCIGIAKVKLADLLVRSGGCAVSLTAKKAVVDACILANNDFDGTIRYFRDLELLGSATGEVEAATELRKDLLIETARLNVVASAVLFDQMPPETLFCMAPWAPVHRQQDLDRNGVQLGEGGCSPPPAQRLEESARKIARENGLVVSARRSHQRSFSDQSVESNRLDASSNSNNNPAAAPPGGDVVSGTDFQLVVARIALSSPHARLLLLPLAVVIDLIVRALDALTWRRPRRTFVLLVCFVLAHAGEIVQVALSVGLSVLVITVCRSALAYSLVDERSPSRDPFLTNSEGVVYSRRSATYNALARARIWLKQGLQVEAFFEIAIVLQLLRQHSASVQLTLLMFSAAFALLSDLSFFILVLATTFIFVPLRLRYGPKLVPFIRAERLRELDRSVPPSPSSGSSTERNNQSNPKSWWWVIFPNLVCKPSNVFSRPFVVTGVAKVIVDPSVDVAAVAPSSLHMRTSSSVLRRRSVAATAAASPRPPPEKRRKIKAKKAEQVPDRKQATPANSEGHHDESSAASGVARSELDGTKTFRQTKLPIQVDQPSVEQADDTQTEQSLPQNKPGGQNSMRRSSQIRRFSAAESPVAAVEGDAVPPLDLSKMTAVTGTEFSNNIVKSSSGSGLARSTSTFWPSADTVKSGTSPVDASGFDPVASPRNRNMPIPATANRVANGAVSPLSSFAVSPPDEHSAHTVTTVTPASSPTKVRQLHCALIVLTLRDASLSGTPAPTEAGSPTTPTTTKAPLVDHFSHLAKSDPRSYHPGVDLVLGKILALYRLAESAPVPPQAPPPPSYPSMFPLHTLSSQLYQSPQQVAYNAQLAAYQQQLLQHNQQYFEEAAATLSLLKKQVVQCEALVTPSPPRYDFPSALLYRAESRVKSSSLVECATNDPVTSTILSVKKSTSIFLGKLPDDSSVDNLIRTRALFSCMLLQASKMSIFAAKDKPRLSFVVPLAPGNQVIIAPNSPCPPHLVNALREAWEGWTEGSCMDGAPQQVVDVMSPEILNTIISQYQGYWKNQLQASAQQQQHGLNSSQSSGHPALVPHAPGATEHHFFHPQPQLHAAANQGGGGLHRADVSFRGRLKSDSASVFHAAKMTIPPMSGGATKEASPHQQPPSLLRQRSTLAAAKQTQPSDTNGDVENSMNTSATSRQPTAAAGDAPRMGMMSPRASMQKQPSKMASHRYKPHNAANGAGAVNAGLGLPFHFAPLVASEGEESGQSVALASTAAVRDSKRAGV